MTRKTIVSLVMAGTLAGQMDFPRILQTKRLFNKNSPITAETEMVIQNYRQNHPLSKNPKNRLIMVLVRTMQLRI